MASAPPNPTQLTPPRVAVIDERSGAISREWYRFFLSLLTSTQATSAATDTQPDAFSLLTSVQQQLDEVYNATAISPPSLNGTVTSVDASGGSTGLVFTGGPITTNGTLVLSGTLGYANGGTGLTATPSNGQLLIGNSAGYTLATLTAGTAISIGNASGAITVTNTAPDQIVSLTGAGTTVVTGTYPNFTITSSDAYVGTVTSVNLTAGTGISVSGGPITTSGSITVVNTAPDQIVSLTGAGTSVVTGTYPNFTITSNDAYVGTVTSVNLTAGTGISVSGGPITSSGSITVVNTAPDQIVSLTGAGTTSITGTYPSFTITSNDAFVGTVTSVSGTGTVNGITLTGTVTSSGSLTLGGTLSGVSLTSQVSGTLPVANGGTGVTTSTGSGSTVLSSQPSFGSTIGVGGASASASGAGVSFPSSQSASTDPNTLDDYEEGSCTITIQDSAGNSATMGGSNVFRYVKVGAFVQVSGTLNWTSTAALSAGSRIQFHGLPFIVNNVGNYRAPALFGSSAPGSYNITRAEIAGGADNGNTFIFGTKVSGNNVDGAMVPADLGSSGTMYGFQINYTTTF
jgi:hypothetical protein